VLVLLAAIASALSAVGVAAAGVRSGAARADAMEPTLTVRTTRYGRILFDGRGQVLYAFTHDRRGSPSRCYGACAKAWPVYYSKSTPVHAGTGVAKSLIGTTRRRDGRRQYTYNGWPLYFYAHEGPREVRCQGVNEFGGLWLVVRPTGTLVG
jgi:predicted lipoprotein with Yx(FWY)xxD motif